jgi:penicillin-binding protein 2
MRRNYQGGEGLPPLVTPQQARDELAKYGTDFWCYRGDLTSEEEKQARAIASQVPGMSVHILKGRRYPFGALAAHVLGYVNDRDRNTSPTSPDDAYGVYGVEKTQDGLLRPIASRAGEAPRRGSDVYLTLDARHQTIIEETLRIARPTIGRASAVLLEANTGDVLAMASVPSFDPNDFVPSISQAKFEEYNSNKTHPLLNRAVRSYVPGATFLVATSLAAICSGHEDDVFRCSGGVSYGSRYFQCWIGQKGGSHGAMHLQRAIAESCGVFFYQLGNAVGNDGLEKTAALCGLGRHTGIELDEEGGGIFPGRTWWMRNRSRDPFTSGTVANISIGQGAAEATPLQLASLTATVANGGTVWKPRLVNRIAPAGDAPNAEVKPRVRTADLREHGLTESGLAILRGGLENVVQSPEGTAKAAQSTVIRIAGKTGTAQNWRMENNETVKDNHTWFICYAPAEKPRWALAVLVQGGKGGGVSTAPIARQILEQVSAIEAGTLKVEPKPMGPVKGGFDAVEQVVLPPWKMPE